jgi:2-desacetyl-2-hydroxyethyl bacteriochlorophyllide A dehydrogenase
MMRTSVYFTAENEVSLADEPVEAVGDGEVLVRSIVSAISAGTELLFLRGQVPPSMAVDDSIPNLARESVRYPLKYGYAVVGRVAQVGRDIDPAMEGILVLAFHPHESCFVTTPDALIELPSDMPPDKAVLLPTMETAASLVMDARPVLGEQIVVVGLGMVGQLATHLLASMSPGRLVCVDPSALRREHALRLGADAVVDGALPDPVESIRRALSASAGGQSYKGADLAVELSGHPSGLDVAIQSLGFNGRVLIGSWYGTKRAPAIPLGGAFHRNHIELVSSQVSHIHPRWRGRWTKPRRLQTALALLAKLDHAPLITHRLPLGRAADAYQILQSAPEDALQVLLTYEEP